MSLVERTSIFSLVVGFISTLLWLNLPATQGFSATAVPEILQDRIVKLPFLLAGDQDRSRAQHVFEYIVEYSELFEETTGFSGENSLQEETFHLSCQIPCISDDIVVDFYLGNKQEQDEESLMLKVSGASLRDFGLIVTNLYGKRELFSGLLQTDELRREVIDHLNREPPNPGFAASTSLASAQDNKSQQDYLKNLINAEHLELLEKEGYVVLETCTGQIVDSQDTENTKTADERRSYATSQQSHEDLSQYLVETTGDTFRNDMVHFLTRPQATQAGLGDHYDMLLSIATYLNTNLKFRKSMHNPIAPATVNDPLTVPRMIQLAQYAQGEYYNAHSDNAYADDGNEHTTDDTHSSTTSPQIKVRQSKVRQNYRHYTCILYCNDLRESDGGALRLFLKSREKSSKDAQKTCQYVDIIPKNGRLLIFDSCMVHSVEEVTNPTKIRRALTLWILRPNDSGVAGELYF